MKVVIFAGGLGTRISEETGTRPKPMVEIGGKPIIWHIMKGYAAHGYNEFIICLGYKGYIIKEYFMHYFLHNSDITIDVANNQMEVHGTNSENFKVTLVETGATTKTAGRLKKVQKYIGNEPFMLTYGDGVADLDISNLVNFHLKHGKLATVTAVNLEARFGGMDVDADGKVLAFREKAKDEGKWINAGFFVLSPDIFKYLEGNMEEMMWEDNPLEQLANAGELVAYHHHGFWKCMDALRDKIELEALWQENNAPWKKWA
ncbi:glucose-1-phosphate cytidylyltransferase [Parasediminibacterium sp. JCM 36343]|uniref:glucose-1-phosphate cytidylyltransferase n=1 Tax=Parasediminibacterium sp. JCM 36343 TaxID=3374279 RepID=UPI00397DB2B1